MFERIFLLRRYGWDGKVVCTGRVDYANEFCAILAKLGLPYRHDAALELIEFSYCEVECFMYLGAHADHFVSDDIASVLPFFDAAISRHQPSALMGNVRDPFVLRYIAERSSIRSVMFLTEDEYPKSGTPGADQFAHHLSKLNKVVVASQYLQRSLQREYDIGAEVLTNAVATSRYAFDKPSPGPYISLLQPYVHKGVELFLDLVEHMPDRQFLVMTGTGEEYRRIKPRLFSLPNLTPMPFTKELKEIYRKSRLVLVPSLWQEAFSRIIIEAFCSGTPVLASGRGGMSDAGGDAACYVPLEHSGSNSYNCTPWIQAIERFDDADFYRESCGRAKQRVAEFEIRLDESMARLSVLLDHSSDAGGTKVE